LMAPWESLQLTKKQNNDNVIMHKRTTVNIPQTLFSDPSRITMCLLVQWRWETRGQCH
jgi:hypothetical protein